MEDLNGESKIPIVYNGREVGSALPSDDWPSTIKRVAHVVGVSKGSLYIIREDENEERETSLADRTNFEGLVQVRISAPKLTGGSR